MGYSTAVRKFNLGSFGEIQYCEWLNPTSQVYFEGVTEEHITRLRSYVKPGDTVIDIGANVGYTLMPQIMAVSPGGTVLAFEPCPESFVILEENARLNSHRCNIRVFNKAVTEKNEKVVMIFSESYHNGSIEKNFVAQGSAGNGHRTECDGIEMESFLRSEGIRIENLSFMKIDAEGYDRKILKSLSWLINRFRPVIKSEYLYFLNDAEKEEYFNIIKELRYRIFWEKNNGGRFIAVIPEVLTLEEFGRMDIHRNMMLFPMERMEWPIWTHWEVWLTSSSQLTTNCGTRKT